MMLEIVLVGAGAVGLMLVCDSPLASQPVGARFTPVSGSRRFK
jgi:hypothetical protein